MNPDRDRAARYVRSRRNPMHLRIWHPEIADAIAAVLTNPADAALDQLARAVLTEIPGETTHD